MSYELLHDNERTLLAWLRTAVALLALGCLIAQLGKYLEQDGRSHAGEVGTYCSGVVIVLVAMFAVLLGLDDYHRRRVALERTGGRAGDDRARSRALYPLAILVGLVGASLLLLMALLR